MKNYQNHIYVDIFKKIIMMKNLVKNHKYLQEQNVLKNVIKFNIY